MARTSTGANVNIVVRSLPQGDFELKMQDKFPTYQKSEGF
jgi:hypothetical protein